MTLSQDGPTPLDTVRGYLASEVPLDVAATILADHARATRARLRAAPPLDQDSLDGRLAAMQVGFDAAPGLMMSDDPSTGSRLKELELAVGRLLSLDAGPTAS